MLPLLNFVLGNLIGVSEIDVQSVELLPGASSVLYGANAFNGILFMTSQSPFTSQGITYAKFGQTSQKLPGQTTMLIMELEWRMRLVQTCRKS
jgi:outer membrane receptor protein involved in Fe transport